jgi:hypothetical protein
MCQAAEDGTIATIDLFLSKGVPANSVTSPSGWKNAIDVARQHGHTEIADMLQKRVTPKAPAPKTPSL